MNGNAQPVRRRIRRTMFVLTIAVFLFLPVSAYLPGASAADIYWDTDMYITDEQTYTGDTITMRGMLSVENGGKLTLDGVTMYVEGTYYWQYLQIEVQNGGTLIIRNSTVQSTDPGWRYFLRAYAGSTLRITNSTIKHCGYGWADSNNLGQRGLYIATNDAVVSGSTLREGNSGVVIDAAKPTVSRNDITVNDENGVEIWNNADPLVENNNIVSNMQNIYGWVWPLSGVLIQNSAGRIYNNTISKNFYMWNWQNMGIGGSQTAKPRIVNNTVKDNTGQYEGVGMYFEGGTAFIDRNSISGHTFGIYNSGASLTVTNNTISDNTWGQWDPPTGIYTYGTDTSINNTITGNRYGIYLGDGASFTSTGDVITGNTQQGIHAEGWNGESGTFFNGTVTGNPTDVNLMDWGGSPPDITFVNMTFDRNGVVIGGGSGRFTVKWFFRAKVLWENGSRPAGGAVVNATSLAGRPVPFPPTDPTTGLTVEKVLEEYSITGTQTTYSTPYNVTAEAGGKTNFTRNVFLDRNTLTTIFLDDMPPPLFITNPADGLLTNQPSVMLIGRTEPRATLTVNGNPVAVPSSGTFTAPLDLPLDGQHTFIVTAVDGSDNWNESRITVTRDIRTPSLAVTSPRENFLVNRSVIEVVGTTDDLTARVTVNWRNATIVNGTFKFSLNLANETSLDTGDTGDGEKQVLVRITDAAGNSATTTRNGTLDTMPPPLTITSPDDNLLTNGSLITVSGTTEKGAIVTMNGNGINSGQEEFALPHRLTRGLNTLEFVAKDRAGNIVRSVVRVTYDPDPPLLAVAFPPDDHLTNDPSLTMTIKTETDASLSLNGAPVLFSAAQFNHTVFLSKGLNTLVLTAVDPAGNSVTLTRKVTLDMEAPLLSVSAPANRTTTNMANLTVSGKTEVGAAVTVSGVRTTADNSGSFSILLLLPAEGENTLVVQASDAAGNMREVVLLVNLDTFAFLEVSGSPGKTKESTLNISGRVEPRATLTVNGQAVPVAADGSFLTTVALVVGGNTFTIETRDRAGNVNQTVFPVIREKRVPASTVNAGLGNALPVMGNLVAGLLGGAVVALLFLRRRKGPVAPVQTAPSYPQMPPQAPPAPQPPPPPPSPLLSPPPDGAGVPPLPPQVESDATGTGSLSSEAAGAEQPPQEGAPPGEDLQRTGDGLVR